MLRTEEAIIIYTSPGQLEQIASNLRAEAKRARLGELIPRVIEYSPGGQQVQFVLHQDLWHEEQAAARQATK